MAPRLDFLAASPGATAALFALESYVRTCGLEPGLMHLVKLRASQINGCAYCIEMHALEARFDGETEARICLLETWRDVPIYSERECAALAWTEALTRVALTHAPDEDYALIAGQFNEAEQVKLSLLIATINAWNRLAVGFRSAAQVAVVAMEAARIPSTQIRNWERAS